MPEFKLSIDEELELCRLYHGEHGEPWSGRELAELFGISKQTVFNILRRNGEEARPWGTQRDEAGEIKVPMHPERVQAIRKAARRMRNRDLAIVYDESPAQISRIVNKRTHKDI